MAFANSGEVTISSFQYMASLIYSFFCSICLSSYHNPAHSHWGYIHEIHFFPPYKLLAMQAWAVTLGVFKKNIFLNTSLVSSKRNQSMFNMSEWITTEWWNKLQTNGDHILLIKHIIVANSNPAKLREPTVRLSCQRAPIISPACLRNAPHP